MAQRPGRQRAVSPGVEAAVGDVQDTAAVWVGRPQRSSWRWPRTALWGHRLFQQLGSPPVHRKLDFQCCDPLAGRDQAPAGNLGLPTGIAPYKRPAQRSECRDRPSCETTAGTRAGRRSPIEGLPRPQRSRPTELPIQPAPSASPPADPSHTVAESPPTQPTDGPSAQPASS
jgi:hypothetical protein